MSGVQVAVELPLDALATGPSRFSAEAGAAHETSVKAKHVTNPDVTIPDDFDPCRMMFPHLRLDASAEVALARRA